MNKFEDDQEKQDSFDEEKKPIRGAFDRPPSGKRTPDASFDNVSMSAPLVKRQKRQAISLNQIKEKLQNNVTMLELRDAENRVGLTPRTTKLKI